jgi:hypothetical protein
VHASAFPACGAIDPHLNLMKFNVHASFSKGFPVIPSAGLADDFFVDFSGLWNVAK